MVDINEDVLNMSVRKFLKQVGVTSQREIEKAVRSGLDPEQKSLIVKMRLTADGTDLDHVVEGKIEIG